MSRPGRYPAPHIPHRQARDARKRKRQKGRGSGADSHHIASHGNPKPPPLSGRKSPPWMAQEGQGGLQPGRILLHYGGAGTFWPCATHDSATRKTKRPYKEESEGRGDAARAAGPGPSERPGRTGRTAARVSAARSSSTRAAATSTSMFARGVAVWGAEKHFFNLRSASRGHFRSIPERLSERYEQDALLCV